MKTGEKQPYVIVLILTYDGKQLLEDSVSSYLENDYPNFDVVVIDNGSTDGTKEYVQEHFPKVSVIRLEKNRGYSRGFNYGLRHVIKEYNLDYVLLTNDDVKVDRKAISEMVKVAETDSNIGFVTGKAYYYNIQGKKNIIYSFGTEFNKDFFEIKVIGDSEEDIGQFDEIEELELCDDCYILVRKEVIQETGGYDDTVFDGTHIQGEEVDWQLRAKKLGYKIYYTPYAKLWHKVGMTTGGPESAYRHYNSRRSRIVLARIHSSNKQFSNFLFRTMFLHLPRTILLHTIKKKRLDIVFAHIKGLVSGIIWVLRAR